METENYGALILKYADNKSETIYLKFKEKNSIGTLEVITGNENSKILEIGSIMYSQTGESLFNNPQARQTIKELFEDQDRLTQLSEKVKKTKKELTSRFNSIK